MVPVAVTGMPATGVAVGCGDGEGRPCASLVGRTAKSSAIRVARNGMANEFIAGTAGSWLSQALRDVAGGDEPGDCLSGGGRSG